MANHIFETEVSRLFEERTRHHQSGGLRGAALFRALASDPALPAHVAEDDVAAILKVQPKTMKARRRKGMPPLYTRRLGQKIIDYDLAALCDMLAEGTVDTRNGYGPKAA